MDILEAIYTRRSVRQYTDEPVSREHLIEIIKAGMWAPSGLNNQPWRFVILRKESIKEQLAPLTTSGAIIQRAPACIGVFIDKTAMYNEVKDHQGIGACIENMLLAAHALGLGAVWLGEILKNGERVRKVLAVDDKFEVMALIAIGHPAGQRSSSRKNMSEVLIKEI